MKNLAIAALLATLTATAHASDTENEIGVVVTRTGTQAPTEGPAENFTGRVQVTDPFRPGPPNRAGGSTVVFEAGARTNWHTHPLGQTLIVRSGRGLVQHEGGPIQEMNVGDVVWIPADVKHWHGAVPDEAMSHMTVSEALDGQTVTWMEPVTDEQYAGE